MLCQVSGECLVWTWFGKLAFLKQMHTISSPQQAHLCPRLTVWWLCQVFGMIRSGGGASWGKNFIKEGLNTVCFNIFKMISLLLLSLLSLHRLQSIWQSWSRALLSEENLDGETEAQAYWGMLYPGGWCQSWEDTPTPFTLVGSNSQNFLSVSSMACLQMESS